LRSFCTSNSHVSKFLTDGCTVCNQSCESVGSIATGGEGIFGNGAGGEGGEVVVQLVAISAHPQQTASLFINLRLSILSILSGSVHRRLQLTL
jgi:hypothetical protein